MTSGIKVKVFGKDIIVDLHTKHGYRKSPGTNARARAVGKCARAANTQKEREDCFAGSKNVTGK